MLFPHIKDNEYPYLNNVDVYAFANEFDYTRWNEKTEIKLCNVLWNSSYTDVVKFATDNARDLYFDNLDDVYTLELETAARVVPEGYIKLPIPYDIAVRYNYMFVDLPIATSASDKIDYETTYGIKRWYFFIDNVVYLSPSTSQCYIAPDMWTIYQNAIDIPYMLLERGHAPVAYSDVDTYLANPVSNNRYLLAPDVSFDNAGITRDFEFVPFGNTTKYVCFASTCSPIQLAQMRPVSADADFRPGLLSYEDIYERYGYQLKVNGLGIGDGRDFSNAETYVTTGISNGNRIANNLFVYAIVATECYGNGTFFNDFSTSYPHFLNTIQACFVIDETCITLGTPHTISGHVLYECVGATRHLLTKRLTVADFKFPTKYSKFAKLYTHPYSILEITDNDDKTIEVHIEETSTLNVDAVTSVAFPYINMRVLFTGIGADSSSAQVYAWRDLNGALNSVDMPD